MYQGWVNVDTYNAYMFLLDKERHLRKHGGDLNFNTFQENAETVMEEESLSVDVEEIMWPDLYQSFCDEARFVS